MDKSFEELYQQLSDNHRARLEEIRKPIARKLRAVKIGCFVLFILSGVSSYYLFLPDGLTVATMYGTLIPLLVVIPAIFVLYPLTGRLMEKYVSYFRENVGASFVEKANPGATYEPEPSRDLCNKIMAKYAKADFDNRNCRMEPFAVRGSPGLSNVIRGEIEGRPYQLTCISLKCGVYNCEKEYKGMFVHMKVSKTLTGFIAVARKVTFLAPCFIFGKEQKMDIPAFEQDFFVGSETQQMAMMYLTADIQELLRDFKDELIHIQTKVSKARPRPWASDVSLDFIWRGDDVYMRVGGKKLFKPNMRDPMCKDSLACCLATMNFVAKLNKVIAKSVKETAI